MDAIKKEVKHVKGAIRYRIIMYKSEIFTVYEEVRSKGFTYIVMTDNAEEQCTFENRTELYSYLNATYPLPIGTYKKAIAERKASKRNTAKMPRISAGGI